MGANELPAARTRKLEHSGAVLSVNQHWTFDLRFIGVVPELRHHRTKEKAPAYRGLVKEWAAVGLRRLSRGRGSAAGARALQFG